MHRLVHSVAMTGVLLHLLGGCCWHHAHAERIDHEGAHHGTAVCLHPHEEDHSCSAEESPHQRTGCDEGGCNFVVPQSVSLAEWACYLHRLGMVYPESPVPLSATERLPSREAPPPHSFPPLRLHLVNQVLLI